MKRGVTKADRNATVKSSGAVAKTLSKVVGVGRADGEALIAATDKTMKKAFPEEKEEEIEEGELE